MNIYPAIDLKSGECVRLYQGCYDKITSYDQDPCMRAKSFFDQGATTIHVVDLDGAKQGKSANLDLILKIAQETDLKIQMGGGIRTKQQVKHLLNEGISRVVLGSIAILHTDDVKEWIQELGCEQIVLAFDVRLDKNGEPKLALHGWQSLSEKSLWQLIDEYADVSLLHVLCTDIQRDGTLQGPNVTLYEECVRRYPSIHFQASGGISTLNDLRALSAIPVASAIVGKAIYENKFSLESALKTVSICG